MMPRWPNLPVHISAGLMLLLLTGCATTDRNQLESALASYKRQPSYRPPQANYTFACPDHIAISVQSRDDIRFHGPIDPEGRVLLPGIGRLRVEGCTPDTVRRHVAEVGNLPYEAIDVQLVRPCSRYIFLTGSVKGAQQAVPYQGPESIIDFLQRSGGLKAGAALNQIDVVRSQVAEGGAPEIYHIDVEAILIDGDLKTNILLQPYDQVYVGQTKRSAIVSLLPPWLRPMFKTVCLFCPNPNALRLRP